MTNIDEAREKNDAILFDEYNGDKKIKGFMYYEQLDLIECAKADDAYDELKSEFKMILLSQQDICNKLQISRATFFKLLKREGFPKPCKFLGENTKRPLWLEHQLDEWLIRQVAK